MEQEVLLRLRQLLKKMQEAGFATLPLDEMIACSGVLEKSHGITIDVAATQELGQPMVVVRMPQAPPCDPRLARLSPRELEVAILIAKGLRNKEIAQTLCISLATVKDHVHHILEKLELPGRTAIAALVLGQAQDATTGD